MFECRSCSSNQIHSIIPLGILPLANALLSSPTIDEANNYNLEVMLCDECGLAQLKDLVDPKVLFSDYVYFSSHSDTMLESSASLVDRLIPSLKKEAFVVEIASNDGYLLKNYVAAGIEVLGIDPAVNIAKAAHEQGIRTRCDFFNAALAQEIAESEKKADIIHANNVMAHVPDINGFILGLKQLLNDNGKIIIEVPYFLDLVNKLEFDTIYHEHVYYFSVRALKTAFERHGLEIIDIEKLDLHGGSLRVFVAHQNQFEVSSIISNMIELEEQAGLYQIDTFHQFMTRLKTLKQSLTEILTNLKDNKAVIAAYGASAKGTTLLNYFGIGQELIDFIVDRSPVKIGKFAPGTAIEIRTPSELKDQNISHSLLLTWNFATEIMRQQGEYIKQGGKFIIPFPTVSIVP